MAYDDNVDDTVLLPKESDSSKPEPESQKKREGLSRNFEIKNAARIVLIGGKGTGKSYLFQSMVQRTQSHHCAGALSYYLDGNRTQLLSAKCRQDPAFRERISSYLKEYKNYTRLKQTSLIDQAWYRLELPYKKGFFGKKTDSLNIEFYDGAGEYYESPLDENNFGVWEDVVKSKIIVYCLPLWIIFPQDQLSEGDKKERREYLDAFDKILTNYEDVRKRKKQTHSVFSILALTQADDNRLNKNGLAGEIKKNWIKEYLDNYQTYTEELKKPHNVLKYIKNTQKVSNLLFQEISKSSSPEISSIVTGLDLGKKPWIIPVSAIQGNNIDSKIEQEPHPIHVELPLLIALCEYTNALI